MRVPSSAKCRAGSDLVQVGPDLGSQQAPEQQDREGGDEDRRDREAADRQQQDGGIVRLASPRARPRAACLRCSTRVVVKIVYASRTMTTTPSGLTGAAMAWSTTKRRLSPMPVEDQQGVDEEEADATGHRADALDHRAAWYRGQGAAREVPRCARLGIDFEAARATFPKPVC